MSFRLRWVVLSVSIAAAAAGLIAPAAAPAAIGQVLGGDVSCSVEPDGIRFCGSSSPRSTSEAFDGVPIDVNVAFPPAPAAGRDGDYPLVMLFHGYGGGKIGLSQMRHWLDKGYATFSMTDRGFRESCGSAASKAADPAGCADGYVRLIDTRYEVRDAQEFAGRLADEGLIDPQRIGATGGSYGGGMSMALAALVDRKMLPDGSLVPWTSPGGTPMQIAAATPSITWSDLAYSLVPNGSTLDYVADAPYQGRFGVMKESLVNGLYVSGQAAPGYYAPPGTASDADLTSWRQRLLAGEPYDGDPQAEAILEEITSHHSSYYIDDSRPPAPLLLANGFTDDLFPVDEMVRFYNRTRTTYPDADISLFAGEVRGHPRSQVKDDVLETLENRQDAWFDHYVKGDGPRPMVGVEAYTQTCPETEPSGGPYTAKSWARLARGEVRVDAKRATTIEPDAGDDAVAAPFNPVSGGGACATADGADQPGTATYRFAAAPQGGFTLMGSPTVIADYEFDGNTSQVAARLLDVGPDGTETLVARGLWRPESGGPAQVFQMHPNGWHFAEGHVAKVELLPDDSDPGLLGGYGRASNDQQPVTVSDVEVRLPLADRPGSAKGFVKAPAPKLVPKGYDLAADFEGLDPRPKLARGPLAVEGDELRAKVRCPRRFEACLGGRVVVRAAGDSRGFPVGSESFELDGGKSEKLEIGLTKKAERYFRGHDGLKVAAKVKSSEVTGAAKQRRRARE